MRQLLEFLLYLEDMGSTTYQAKVFLSTSTAMLIFLAPNFMLFDFIYFGSLQIPIQESD